MTTTQSTQNFALKISESEHRARCQALAEKVEAAGLTGVVLFDRDYILYYTGFAFIPTERPIALLMSASAETSLYVPRLEVEHARANADVDHVEQYQEYPGLVHPMENFSRVMERNGLRGKIGADNDGYPWILGYRGKSLSELGFEVTLIRGMIEDQMAIKSAAELALIQESCRWGNLAHMLLQRYTRPGETETVVTQRASNEATRAMYDAIGPVYRSQGMFSSGAFAGYRGQIGRNSAIPHALANNITFQPGDVLVTGAAATVWGYHSELERTMIIGQPDDDQKRFFDHMVALQDLALATMEPGKPCSEVDNVLRKYYDNHKLMDNWRHHVGHCIGLRYHEGPFLDTGDETVMQPGMVFTVEPGLYAANSGGFRHSDTVAITEQGIQMMTYYPRDLESLIIPV